MNDNRCQAPQLVAWYRAFLEHEQSATFVSIVSRKYTLATLQRMTVSHDAETRRAAVLALGMVGGGESIAVVGRCLQDADRCVRLVAEVAFTDLARREMGTSLCRQLDEARRHTDGHRYDRAMQLLDDILAVAPSFSEAWYQHGIVQSCRGDYRRAIRDAKKTVALNSFHFSAMSLQGRCYVQLDEPLQALKSFRRSLAINPSQVLVREYVEVLTRHSRRLHRDDSTSDS